MNDNLRTSLGHPAIQALTRIWSHEPHREVRTVVDPPHIAPRRLACPTYQGDPDEMVICVGPDNSPMRRSEVEYERVHDEETLLGAVVYVFGKQASSAARRARIAEEVVSDSLVIALSKIRRAEDEHGVKALIPEGLVYYVVRGALRHRSFGDGRHMSTESCQAREKLALALERLEREGEDVSRPGFRSALAAEIRDAYPKRRRPTLGYELDWQEVPKPHLSDDLLMGYGMDLLTEPDPSTEDAMMGSLGIPEISRWQDSDLEAPEEVRGKAGAYYQAVLHAGAPLLAPRARDRRRGLAVAALAEALGEGPAQLRGLISGLGDGSEADAMFDPSDRSALLRLRELVDLCDDDQVEALLRSAVSLASRHGGSARLVTVAAPEVDAAAAWAA